MKGSNFSWPKWLGDLVMSGRLATVKPSAQRVLLGIAPHFSDEGRCYPGQRRIRSLLSMSDAALRNGLSDLVKAGILRADKAHGTTTSYYARTSLDTNDHGTVSRDSSVGDPRSLVTHEPGTPSRDSSVGESESTHQRSLGEVSHDHGTKPFQEPERLSDELRAAPPAGSENDPEADPDLDGSDEPESHRSPTRSPIWNELAGEGVTDPTRSALEERLLQLADGPTALRALRHLAAIARANATTGTTASYLVALVRREAEATILAIKAGTLDRKPVDAKPAAQPDRWAIERQKREAEQEAARDRKEAEDLEASVRAQWIRQAGPRDRVTIEAWEDVRAGLQFGSLARLRGATVEEAIEHPELLDLIARRIIAGPSPRRLEQLQEEALVMHAEWLKTNQGKEA